MYKLNKNIIEIKNDLSREAHFEVEQFAARKDDPHCEGDKMIRVERKILGVGESMRFPVREVSKEYHRDFIILRINRKAEQR